MKYGLVYLGGLLAVLAAGCSSDDIALEPTHATYSYEQVKDQEIALPANYNKNNYRKLLLGVAVNDIGVKAGEISPNVVQTLSTRLQTEMAKLKRFSVFSAHNRGGVLLFQSLADVGDAKMPDKNPREMDLILSASITVSKEKTERKYDDLLIYEVECDFSCEDIRTGEVKFAEKATGRTARAVKFGLGGDLQCRDESDRGGRQQARQLLSGRRADHRHAQHAHDHGQGVRARCGQGYGDDGLRVGFRR